MIHHPLSWASHTGPYGDKLKTASCSCLASISIALRKLDQLDSGLVHTVAQLTCKKAKHGSLTDLAALAYVLHVEGWQDKEVIERALSMHTLRVGQNQIYTPYMTVYLVKFLPKTPYLHRIYISLANFTYAVGTI